MPQEILGRQIIRSADSIGANIAEGVGRGSYQDNKRFIKIARRSLYETQHWLRQTYKRRLLTNEQIDKLKVTINDLAPQFNSYLKSIGNQSEQQLSTNDQ